MPTIFAPPIGAHHLVVTVRRPLASRNKRKRTNTDEEDEEDEENETIHEQTRRGLIDRQSPTTQTTDPEYTAVVSPDERLQRRVAGQPLDQPPPPLPFPHAQPSLPVGHKSHAEKSLNVQPAKLDDRPRSLHFQHLAALTAVVHRSLLKEDFSRASRALGLLFREDLVRRSAAIRTQGLVGIAAETLLRQGSSRKPATDGTSTTFESSLEGLENAKRFYKRLIIQHPYHKSWPGSVNAVDFYIAMFNLWIFAVQAQNIANAHTASDVESSRGSATSSPLLEKTGARPGGKARELEQADEIASAMDTCMASMPFQDERELVRLRAMVALWIADLHEGLTSIARLREQVSESESYLESGTSSPTTDDAIESRDQSRAAGFGLEGSPSSDG